jgi:predicted acyltransferase
LLPSDIAIDIEISQAPPSTEAPLRSATRRLVSLDAFRGLTVLLMLLVNNAAMDVYTPAQFMHAAWNQGLHLADLVFPWFLFAVGIAVPFSFRSAVKRGASSRQIYTRVVVRTVALLVMGCLVDSAVRREFYVGLGVLQLIGLSYWAGSVLYALTSFQRAAAVCLLLLGYGLAVQFVPVPGVGLPVFEENRNLIHFVNMEYLLDFRMKGLLSVIPTGALVGIGTFIGDLALGWVPGRLKRAGFTGTLIGGGAILLGLGLLWSLWLPLNKPVWTSSYILVSAGLGSILIAVLSLLFDSGKCRLLALPLLVLGSNALLAYVGPILIKVLVLQEVELERQGSAIKLQDWLIQSLTDPFGQSAGGWAYTISYVLAVWIGLALLYRKQWFLRV